MISQFLLHLLLFFIIIIISIVRQKKTEIASLRTGPPVDPTLFLLHPRVSSSSSLLSFPSHFHFFFFPFYYRQLLALPLFQPLIVRHFNLLFLLTDAITLSTYSPPHFTMNAPPALGYPPGVSLPPTGA